MNEKDMDAMKAELTQLGMDNHRRGMSDGMVMSIKMLELASELGLGMSDAIGMLRELHAEQF